MKMYTISIIFCRTFVNEKSLHTKTAETEINNTINNALDAIEKEHKNKRTQYFVMISILSVCVVVICNSAL